jgi:hypothetical protein
MVKGDAPLSGEHKFFHKVKYNLAIHNQLNESVTRGSDVCQERRPGGFDT